ncbi:MAG: AtpZ/AtpI family protein [Deltaproteobacteria bacterium]|jgi:ATP synthase protein I|nr:AtpZ/AtpI family protein [Deltaproteobacteria bacterium]MBT6435909.1 AtpZ/AtpI family protein [Deltaproteobacteria bacterium]MBT6489103.1 AtpZ/AtpI family protein [Deltaproteobacteria bacterium]
MGQKNKGLTERQRMWRLAGRYSSVGVEMAVCIGGSTLAGHYADRHFGTKPWLFLFGLVVGTGAAIKAVVRIVRQFKASNREQDQTSADE